MFINEKSCGTVKGQLVAGGDRQRSYMNRDNVSSFTCSTESIMLTSLINAHEERDGAVLDIPNAFVQTDVDTNVIVKLRGKVADFLINRFPGTYNKFLFTTSNTNQSILYVKLNKALYGIMQAAILFYNKVLSDLQAIGFTLNPYDQCVMNAQLDGSTFTIVWHVDDFKLSHCDPTMVTRIVKWFERQYAETFGHDRTSIKVVRGPRLIFLGMTINHTMKRKVRFTMKE